MWEIIKEFLTPAVLIPAATAIITAVWGGYIYLENRAAKAREAERAAWRELADFHKATLDMVREGVRVRTLADSAAINAYRVRYRDWDDLLTVKRGLIGPKGRKRAQYLSLRLSELSGNLASLKDFTLKEDKLITAWELIQLHSQITGDVTYFIH